MVALRMKKLPSTNTWQYLAQNAALLSGRASLRHCGMAFKGANFRLW
jgi:hypothetical protein